MSEQEQSAARPRRVRDFSLPELGRPAGEAEAGAPALGRNGFIPFNLREGLQNPLEDAHRQAQEIISGAQGQAQDLRQRSQEEGYQKGYQSGMEEGLVAGKARVEAACDNLGRALVALERARAGVLMVMEEEILALVQAVTDRILLAPGAVDPDLVRRVVRQAILRLSQAERLSVRLHPDDIERVREFRPRLLEGMPRLKYLDLVPDLGLRPGDCLVDGPQSQVDATLATRRERIFNLLGETFHQSQRLELSAALEQALAADQAEAEPAPEPAPAAPAKEAAAPAAELEEW